MVAFKILRQPVCPIFFISHTHVLNCFRIIDILEKIGDPVTYSTFLSMFAIVLQ